MAKLPRDDDGLTRQEGSACRYVAEGLNQSDAYRRAFDKSRAKAKTINEAASRLFAKPAIQKRVRELLRLAKVQDIQSVGESYRQMLLDMAAARTDGNHNALMGYNRINLQVHGALKDNVSMTMESSLSDEDLIQRMAGDDPRKIAAARVLLGAADTFDA